MSLESDAMPFTIGFRHEQLDGGSDDFVFSITKDGLRSQIPENDSTVLIGKDDRVARRLNDRPKAKFGSPQSVSLTLQFFERASLRNRIPDRALQQWRCKLVFEKEVRCAELHGFNGQAIVANSG